MFPVQKGLTLRQVLRVIVDLKATKNNFQKRTHRELHRAVIVSSAEQGKNCKPDEDVFTGTCTYVMEVNAFLFYHEKLNASV